jgi:hypothetical protein
LLQDICFFTDFISHVLSALIARLEAAEKALSEERAARLATNQFLAKEKAAQLIADQSLRASHEANAALT